MEPTLLARSRAVGCTATFNDRVIAAKIVYRFRNPERGEIAVFDAPPAAKRDCHEGGTFVKRVDRNAGRQSSGSSDRYVYIDGKRLARAVHHGRREPAYDTKTWPRLGPGRVLRDGRPPQPTRATRAPGARSPRSAFVGPVVATYWPPTRWSFR